MRVDSLAVGDLLLDLRPLRHCLHGPGRCDWSGDDCYVRSSAVRTVRTAKDYKDMDGTVYHATVGESVRALLDSCPVRLAAYLPEDPGLVVAFVCGTPGDVPVLVYLHVRSSFCKMGIAEALALRTLGISRDRPVAVALPTRALDTLTESPRWTLRYGRPS